MYSQHHFRCLEGAGSMHPARLPGCVLSRGIGKGPGHQGQSSPIPSPYPKHARDSVVSLRLCTLFSKGKPSFLRRRQEDVLPAC